MSGRGQLNVGRSNTTADVYLARIEIDIKNDHYVARAPRRRGFCADPRDNTQSHDADDDEMTTKGQPVAW